MSQNQPTLVFNKLAFDGVAMSTDRTSDVIALDNVLGYCVHWRWTGTPVGNLLIEGSNDGTNFTTVDTQAAGGAPSSKLFNQASAHYMYLRLSYGFTSGTGVLTAHVSGK